MKLLFDQNLSYKLCRSLADLFPESAQVRRAGLAEADELRGYNLIPTP
jgi:predicted nuclease of predicted toxin-antitoxin system